MTGVKRIKRKRGRPLVPPDYLLSVFRIVEEERRRTGLSVKRVCELIIKRGPLRLTRLDEKVEIKSARTLRSRYQEVLAALSPPRIDIPEIDEVHYRRMLNATADGVLLMGPDEQYISPRTGKLITTGRILGQWGETKKALQAGRQAVLQAQRKTTKR